MVPDDSERLDFDATGVNIKPFVEEGARIQSSASGTVPADDVTFVGEVHLTLQVL